jgi:hypothetical protein
VQGASGRALDHTQPASGQPRVDPEHTHRHTALSSEHLFGTRLRSAADDSVDDAPKRQPTRSITSSLTSKFAHTFWTSSESSSASIRRKTFLAPSSSSGTLTEGRNEASAES